MAQHYPLGISCRARGVIQRDRLPFIVGQAHRELWVTVRDERLIIAIDIEDAKTGRRHQWGELAIDQRDLGFGVLQDKANADASSRD